MRIVTIDPPRRFGVGRKDDEIQISHVANIELSADEQVTFVTPGGREYDVVRKSWGYYATPSLDSRLRQFGLRPALVSNGKRRYLLLVEVDRMAEFNAYITREGLTVTAWLDTAEQG